MLNISKGDFFMKRSGLLLALMGLLVLVVVAIPVTAEEHEIEEHPHMLLQRPVIGLIDGWPHLVEVRKCVDLANNQDVPLNAHHVHIHFGDAGVSFGGEARHAVIPADHFPTHDDPLPWANCEEFLGLLPFPLPPED
jgi:hypothetical protein